MVDVNVVAVRLGELADKVSRVRRFCPENPEALTEGSEALDLVSFNLLLAVQACLDLASHLISDQGWPTATNLAGAFRALHEHGVISEDVAAALGRAAGLRNLVAHGYSRVDPRLIHQAATEGLADLERFASQVSSWVAEADAR